MPLKSVTQFSNKEYYAARDALLEEETTNLQPTEGQPDPAPEVDPTLTAAPEVDGNFVRGLKGGVDNMQALGGGLKALAGSVVGNEEMVAEGMEYYQEQTAEAEQYKPDSTFQEIDSATDFGAWAAYTIGSVVPDLVGMVGTGGAGGLLAKSAVKQGVTEMAETLSKQATERLVKEGIEDQAAEKIARNMADKFAKAKIKKMTTRGATAGAFAYGTQQGASSTFARTLEETGEEAPLAAAVSGLTIGALNALPAFSALTKFLPKGKVDEAGEFISGVVNDKPAWVGEFVKDVTTQMGVESGTEALQLIVEEEIISFVNNNYTENESREYFDYISNERKRSSLIEASAAGFLFGGATGAVGAGVKGATGGYNANANLGDDAKVVRTRSMNDPEFAGRIRQMYDEAKTNAANGVRSIPLGDQSFLDDNPPLTNAERREAGLTELTNYDGTDMDIPDSGPDVDVPAVASVAVDQENSEFGENTLPPSPQAPQADIVTDFPASTASGATKVRKGIRQFGHEHTFDAPMSLQAKPIQDQLIEIAVAANTPEALDPTNTDTVVEAIDMDDVERVFSRNQEFAIKLESGERADLPTIQEAYGDKSAEMETLTAGVMADLSANGLPRSFVDAVSGVFVHKQSQVTSPAITGNTTNGISINADLLGKALTEQDSLSELGWTLAHEVYHAADNSFNLSAADPSLDIRIDEMGEDPSVFMGEVMQEIFENWTKATDVGRRFDYPFNDLNDEILDTSKDNGEINRRYQKEVFAQLGAFFHSNPKQLKAEAPLAYNYIKGIRDKNLQTAQTVEAQDEVIQSTSPADTSQPEGISGQVRAPPESGVIEGIQPDSVGRDSETSARSEPADTGVARPQQDGSGQRERRDVQEREVTAEQPRTEVELKATNKKPTFKKADNWEDTGEQIITFDDGDRYTVYFDEDSAESGEEQWYTSSDGTFTGAEAMLGETKAETITALQDHRQKLLDAGEKSYNTPLDPQVGGDTTFKAWDFISDKGQVTEKQLRAKFKRLEDNQFDNLVEGLLGETDPESVITLEDGKFLSYEYVQERDLDVLQSDLDDMDFIKKSDLSPMAQEITASDVLYGNESLDIVGTSRNGATVVVDLGRAFDDRVRAATGGRNLGDQTPENAAIVSDLIAHEAVQAMKTDGNAGEWYQEKVANAMSIAAKEFPELEADANAKFAFTSIMAITSNGASVPDNSVNTFEIYQEYRDSKVFPDFGVGVTSEAMKNAFALLNRLIEQNGIDSTRQFMDVDVTVKELKDSFGLAVSGELMGTELKGSAIIGPKIGGGFYQNLNGNFDPLTMDRWFMRTWGRLTGTLMADAERKLPVQMAKFREVALGDEYRSKLKKDGINRSQLTKDDEYAKAYGIKVQSAYANGGFKEKSTINKAANNFKNSQGEKQAPQNGKEREYIRSVMRMALDKVNETSGQAPVNMGALQAIIWYPEKDLYKQLGVGNAKSEPTDYETEFGKIVQSRQRREQKLSGSVGAAQQSGAGGVQSGIEPDVQDSGQSSGRQAEQSDSIQDPNKRRADRERAYKELRSARPSDSGSGGTEGGIPRRFRRRASKHSQVLVAGQKVSGYKRELETGAKAALQLVNTYNGTVVELVQNKTNAQLFASKMQASKDASPYGAAVFVYPESDYQNMKLFMTEDGSAGIAIEDGDTIVSLYSDGTNPNVTYSLASLAVEEGGRYSDAFDTQLPYIYQHVGFKVISRLKWDDSQAPSDWDKDTFKVFNKGKPDVVFMVVDPEYFGPYSKDVGDYVETYDEGLRSVRETESPAPKVERPEGFEDLSFIKKKQINKETGTLDDGSQSTNAFTYNDEIDGQADLSRRLKNRPIYKSLVDKYSQQEDFEAQAAEYLGVGRLPAELSPRDQENLAHGKVQNDLNDFHENYVDPLGDLIAELKADPDAIGTYLIAKHAAERNDVIAGKVKAQRDRNIARTEKQMESLLDDVESDHTVQLGNLAVKLKSYKEDPLLFQDTGSGMTYDEARSVLNLAEKEGTKADMERIASKVYDMLKHQREIMVSSGLMDADSVADWEATYEFYVPLKGFAAEPEGDTYKRTSKANGFSVVGSESMKAKGRKTLPVNPLFTAIEDVQMKIIRAQKNQTAQTFLDLLSKLGNSDSYTIYNNKFRPPKDSDHLTMQDLDQMARDTRTNGDPKYVQVKKGGQTFFIHFKSDTLNHALQDMSVAALDRNNTLMDKALTFATRFQTFRRNMLINYNPSWGLVNPLRDVQTGLMYALSEKDKKGSRVQGDNLIGKMAQSYLPSMRAMYRTLRGKPVINEMGKYAAEFMEDGASTGLMLVRDQAEQLRILKNKLKRGYTREALTAIGDWIEAFNSTMENAVRLAAYTEARKAGTDRQTAATLAKDLTVNFNRKGENTAQVNAGYLFFGAAVQGNVNFAQTLASDKGAYTDARATVAGLVALGGSLAVMNILSSEEDEDGERNYADLPEHAKNRSLLFMYSDLEGFALPASYGYNFFTNIGRLSAEMVFGINTPEESAQYLAENVLLNFVPISPSSGDSWEEMARGFYPDLLEVHLDLLANKNFFGSDIYIEQNSFMIERSNAYNSRRSTDKAFTSTAKFLNDATGGDKYEDGVLSFNPDKMEYVYEYFLGGVGRFVSQTGDVAARMMADEEFRNQDMPIIGTFFESPSEYEDRFEFYANWEESRKIEARLKEASTEEELVGLRQKYQSFIPVLDGGRNSPYKTANRDLRNISKTRKIVEAQDIPEERRREMLKKLLDNENKIFDLYNKMYRKAEKGIRD